MRNKIFSEEVLDMSFVDSDDEPLPFIFAMFKHKQYKVVEYALFLELHYGVICKMIKML